MLVTVRVVPEMVPANVAAGTSTVYVPTPPVVFGPNAMMVVPRTTPTPERICPTRRRLPAAAVVTVRVDPCWPAVPLSIRPVTVVATDVARLPTTSGAVTWTTCASNVVDAGRSLVGTNA